VGSTKDMADSMSNAVEKGVMDIEKLKEAMLKMPKEQGFAKLYGKKMEFPQKLIEEEQPKVMPGGAALKFESKITHKMVAPKFGIKTGEDGFVTITPPQQTRTRVAEEPMTPRQRDFAKLNK